MGPDGKGPALHPNDNVAIRQASHRRVSAAWIGSLHETQPEDTADTRNVNEPDFILLGDSCRAAADNMRVIIQSLEEIVQSLKIGEICSTHGYILMNILSFSRLLL